MEILIVDDEITMRETLKRGLITSGFKVVEAVNGVEALDKLKSSRSIELVITDAIMPKMDGPTLLKKIREIYPTLPAILMTAQPYNSQKIEALKSNNIGFISKPFSLSDLTNQIQAALK